MFSITQPKLMKPKMSPLDAGALFLESYMIITSVGLPRIDWVNGIGSVFCATSAIFFGSTHAGGNIAPRIPVFFFNSSSFEKESCS